MKLNRRPALFAAFAALAAALAPGAACAQSGPASAPVPGNPAADRPQMFTIPLERQQLIGVTFAAAEVTPLRRTIRAAGVVAATMSKHWDYVARVDGYVHNLNVVAPGDPVEKGQVLMDLYSPDLVATEEEYIDLLHLRESGRRDHNAATEETAARLLAGARDRLQQWNISDEQIAALERAGHPEQYLALQSPIQGIVEAVNVHQGRRVSPGDHLVDLVDLSTVCVYADFYQAELALLKPGLPVTISTAALPGLALAGSIGVIDPNFSDTTRTGKARIDVANPGTRLRPGAYVDVTLELDEGSGLTIPLEAVLPTGEHNVIFVDRGGGKLEPRFVELGGRFGDRWQVKSGLAAGERVVTSANFLIDAESKVQGAMKSW
jgi:Cu(I)/Ag(I) efflux system membrane fusion protein